MPTGAAVDFLRRAERGPRCSHAELYGGRRQPSLGLHCGCDQDGPDFARFIERAKLEAIVAELGKQVEIVYLEDVRATITSSDKIRGLLFSRRAIERRDPQDAAVVLFTSGPKVLPRAWCFRIRISTPISRRSMHASTSRPIDIVFNVLPVFHSSASLARMLLPMLSGMECYLYPRRCTIADPRADLWYECHGFSSAPIRSSTVMRARPMPMTSVRCATSLLAQSL